MPANVLMRPATICAATAPSSAQAAGSRKRLIASLFKRGSPPLLRCRVGGSFAYRQSVKSFGRFRTGQARPARPRARIPAAGRFRCGAGAPPGHRSDSADTVHGRPVHLRGPTAHTPSQPARLGRMRIVVPAGGIGGARFLRGLKATLGIVAGQDSDSTITVIGNTGDDITLFGLRVCPDLDTVMYTLGGGINEDQVWGRDDESFTVKEELLAYGMQPDWFGLGDPDVATHIVRSQMLAAVYPLSAVTEALCDRWRPGVRLIPMTDDQVETHVVVEEGGKRRALHFQEWWIRHR